MSAFLVAIIGGTFGLVSAILGAFTTYFLNKKGVLESKNNILSKAREVGYLLGWARMTVGAKRCVLVRVENGKIRDADSTKFISVVDESYEPPMSGSHELFQRYRTDAAYKQIFQSILSEESLCIPTSAFSSGFLKNYYEAVGIAYSIAFRVYESERQLWYVSLSFTEEIDHIESKVANVIDTLKHKIGRVLEENPEVGK